MIGDKSRRIEIWKHDGTRNAANELAPDGWHLYLCRWASIRGDTGMATIRASANGIAAPLNRYSFRVNWTPAITEAMQVRYKDARYNILSVRHDQADRNWTDIVAELGGSNG